MQKLRKTTKNGYTIIETMIAVSLFLIVVTIGMGALLNANLIHNKAQNMRSVLDNLNFVMEDMSRNIRTGYSYYCIPASLSIGSGTLSGSNCSGIAFQPAGDSSNLRWVYEIVTAGGLTYVRRSTDNGATWVQLTPDEINIDTTNSFFNVLGAEPPPDPDQPFVTIKLVGNITYNGVDSPFSLQTSVSQRKLDI